MGARAGGLGRDVKVQKGGKLGDGPEHVVREGVDMQFTIRQMSPGARVRVREARPFGTIDSQARAVGDQHCRHDPNLERTPRRGSGFQPLRTESRVASRLGFARREAI